MQVGEDILISLSPPYTRAILAGRKTVELRRRPLRVAAGTRVWIYSKIPVGRIEAAASVVEVREASPADLWAEFGSLVGVTRAEFDRYFEGCARGCAVLLADARAVFPPVALSTLRARLAGFQPPQFFRRLARVELDSLPLESSVS